MYNRACRELIKNKNVWDYFRNFGVLGGPSSSFAVSIKAG